MGETSADSSFLLSCDSTTPSASSVRFLSSEGETEEEGGREEGMERRDEGDGEVGGRGRERSEQVPHVLYLACFQSHDMQDVLYLAIFVT